MEEEEDEIDDERIKGENKDNEWLETVRDNDFASDHAEQIARHEYDNK